MWGFHDFLVILGAVLGFLFAAYLIDAIRIQDEEKANCCKMKACLTFGALVFIVLCFLNS